MTFCRVQSIHFSISILFLDFSRVFLGLFVENRKSRFSSILCLDFQHFRNNFPVSIYFLNFSRVFWGLLSETEKLMNFEDWGGHLTPPPLFQIWSEGGQMLLFHLIDKLSLPSTIRCFNLFNMSATGMIPNHNLQIILSLGW